MRTQDVNIGMQWQRGMDVVQRTLSEGLPLLLSDDDLQCLKIAQEQLQSLPGKTNFGPSGPEAIPYMKKLLATYSDPETIKNGLRVMDQMGQLDFTHAGHQYVFPYEEQVKKVNFVPSGRK